MFRDREKDGTVRLTGGTFFKEDADKLYLPKYQEYDSGWITIGDLGAPAYQAGGVYGGAFGTPRFRRIGDIVYMEGLVGSPPAAGGVIFTLPDGFRPDGDIIPVGQGNGATENHAVKVYANGNVVTGAGVSGWASLVCQFPVAGAADPWHVIGAAGEIAFGSGWRNYGGGWQTARYKRVGDFVYLSGLVTRDTTATNSIFTLPTGFVNTNGSTHTPAAGSSALLGADGGVNIAASVICRGSGTVGYISLAGIRFFVGANDKKWKKFRGGANDGWFGQPGPYGGQWPVPAVRRDGKIIFLEGLANFAATGAVMKLPYGYMPGAVNIFPTLQSSNKRIDIKSPYEDSAAGTAGTIAIYATGTMGFTNSWVVAEAFEGDIRWNS